MPEPTPVLPADLLAAAQRRDPARPLLTWYQPATGARVELSVVTFATWVAKTCGLLTDELDLAPGDVVEVRLPAHWLGPVWAQAVWTVGGRLRLPSDAAGGPARVVVRAAGEPGGEQGASDELVVVSTAPLGGPAGALTPPGALDYGREVPGQPDRFVPLAPPPPDPVPLDPVPPDLAAAARARVDERGRGRRALVLAERLDRQVVLEALLVPLLGDGSAVLVHGAAEPDAVAAIAAAERVDLTTGRS